MAERKKILLRLDPAVHDALAKWAADELRSTNGQIELLLRRALAETGRLPSGVGALPRRGRPPKQQAEERVEERGTADASAADSATEPAAVPTLEAAAGPLADDASADSLTRPH